MIRMLSKSPLEMRAPTRRLLQLRYSSIEHFAQGGSHHLPMNIRRKLQQASIAPKLNLSNDVTGLEQHQGTPGAGRDESFDLSPCRSLACIESESNLGAVDSVVDTQHTGWRFTQSNLDGWVEGLSLFAEESAPDAG